jgi:Rne/Rng family ribonuclease
MIDEILISTGPRRHRIALLAAGRLVELHISPRGGRHLERIILGRVTKVQNDLDAAFIDIGEGREGLLSAADTAAKRGTPISMAVQEGQTILVQLTREAEAEKGAKLSARPRLANQGMVLLPMGRGVELSKRIKEPGRRADLQLLATSLRDRFSCGLVLRSGAAAMADDHLLAGAEALFGRWQKIEADAGAMRPPALLHSGDDPVALILRAHGGAERCRIRMDDAALAGEMGRTIASVELHDGRSPLFLEHDLEGQIDQAMAAEVRLPGGGRIIIEHTQALTAIDVDSGQHDGAGDPRRLAREINTQAAREIARQLRLREIGGRVVIDFMPLHGKGEVAALLDKLRGWLAHDPGQVRLGRMSELGLVELTRRRRQPALALRLGAPCAHCQGSGLAANPRWVADNLLDRILREADVAKGGVLEVRAAPAVAADLGGPDGKLLGDLARKQGCRVHLAADKSLALDEFEITATR